MKLTARKSGTKIIAETRLAIDTLDKIKDGTEVMVEVVKKRSLQHHKRFFALVHFCWEHQPEPIRYETAEAMRAAILISAGHRVEIHLPGGTVGYMASSIAFDKLDQVGFNDLWRNSCDAIQKHYVPGITDEHIRQGIVDLIGEAA